MNRVERYPHTHHPLGDFQQGSIDARGETLEGLVHLYEKHSWSQRVPSQGGHTRPIYELKNSVVIFLEGDRPASSR